MRKQWGPLKRKPSRSPLNELILTILSQNTNDLNSGRAFSSLRHNWPNWDAVRRASLSEIEGAIRQGGLSHVKAKRIKAILGEICRERGDLNLIFLQRLSDREIWAYLRKFKGVGPKTVACVMLFSLGRSAFPVDTHVFRVIGRLKGEHGKASPSQVQEELQKNVPPKLMYPLHLHLVQHGREICRPHNPYCGKCSLLPLCAYGSRFGRSGEPTSKVG